RVLSAARRHHDRDETETGAHHELLADPLTLALASTLTLTEAEAVPAMSMAAPMQPRASIPASATTLGSSAPASTTVSAARAARFPIPSWILKIAGSLYWRATASFFRSALASPLASTKTCGGSHFAICAVLALQRAWHEASTLGGLNSPVHFGALNSAVQEPVQVPLHFASPLSLHSPWQVPLQVPSQLPLVSLPSHSPWHLPWHSPSHFTPPCALQVPLHAPLHWPAISPPSQLASSLPGSIAASQPARHCVIAS